MITRKCIVCLSDLMGAMDGNIEQGFSESPSNAVVFTATGNYGSTIFDEPGRMLEVSICDHCLVERGQHVLHATFRDVTPRRQIENVQPFSMVEVPESYRMLLKRQGRE